MKKNLWVDHLRTEKIQTKSSNEEKHAFNCLCHAVDSKKLSKASISNEILLTFIILVHYC